jgi:hypothetical protein
LYGCGEPIGYHEVDGEIRYYHSSDPEWLPSAAGPGKKKTVFQKLENVNISAFEIYETIAKDDKNVWYKGEPIIGADSESFIKLDGPYQKDKESVYFEGERFENVNPDQFEVIKNAGYIAYARSDNQVFFRDKSLNVNSVQGFEIIQGSDSWAKDGINYYFWDRKIPLDNYNDIEIINSSCFKDNSYVFHINGEEIDTVIVNSGGNIDIPDLDIQSIKKTEHTSFIKDKFGYIDVHSKIRVSVKDYEYQIDHDN